MMFCACMRLDLIFVAPAPKAIPSAVGVAEALEQRPSYTAVIPPSIIQDMSHVPSLLERTAKNLEYLYYGGGDLPQSVGDFVNQKIKLVDVYGSTEMGVPPLLSAHDRHASDWKYLHFRANSGYEMRAYDGNVYELVVNRKDQDEEWQVPFKFYPSLDEYHTNDLWSRHPEHPDLYRWEARADDIIVFLNGEKTNPVSMEMHIVGANQEVSAALVVGARRFQAALLVEMADAEQELSPKERAHMIEKIWPSVEEANRECPAHARIDRSHVLFVDPNKPMARAGKGTVMRFATLTAYREEIDRLYHDAETIVDPGDIPEQAINLGDEDAVKDFVRKSVLSVTKWQTLGGADDLFGHGMDSLQGMMVLRKLRTGLKMPKMALTMIYVNPTIDTLARAIASSTEDQSQSGSSTREALLQAREQLMKRFNTEIDSISIPDSSPAAVPNTHTVLLTGSTGALGSYMLDHLLSLPSTRHVYCLNRSADSARLQSSRNATRGLPTTFSEDRVSFLTADLTQSSFLLDKAKYDELLGSTTMIIHNAWPVNFNHPLPSFATSLATIPTLLKFSATARYRPHVHFVSSISSVMAYQASKTIPAKVVDSADVAAEAGGYGHSKQLGELLLNHASQRLPLSVSFSRVGQIAGAVSKKGLWNPAEWFPSIVLSSRYIGAIPETLGGMDRVDWMPIDSLSRTIVELVQNSAGKQSSADGDANGQGAGESDHADDGANGTHRRGRIDVFHPHNPTTRSWADLRPVVMQALQSQTAGRNFEVVPFKAWLGRVKGAMDTALEQSSSVGANGDANGQADGHLKESSEAASSDGVEKRLRLNPAAKLLDFYQGLLEGGEGALFELDSTVEQSATLQGLEGVGVKDEWVRKWVEEWTEWIDDQE
jgi:thioester reductase-like protein/aryl carrier-like protein